jgi:hypothetical protein
MLQHLDERRRCRGSRSCVVTATWRDRFTSHQIPRSIRSELEVPIAQQSRHAVTDASGLALEIVPELAWSDPEVRKSFI